MDKQDLGMVTIPYELLYRLYHSVASERESILATNPNDKDLLPELDELIEQTSPYLFSSEPQERDR